EVIPSDCASALVIDPARAKATSPPFRPHPTAFPNAGMLGKLPGARLSTWAACFVVIAAAPFVAPRLAPAKTSHRAAATMAAAILGAARSTVAAAEAPW